MAFGLLLFDTLVWEPDTTGPDATEPDRSDAGPTERTAASTVLRSSLRITALNASGINGHAGQAQQLLDVAGYSAVTTVTAAAWEEASSVYYSEGFETEAVAIAVLLDIPRLRVQVHPGIQLARDSAEYPPDTEVAIVLGPDSVGALN